MSLGLDLLQLPGGDLALAGVVTGVATAFLAGGLLLWRVARELQGRTAGAGGPVEVPPRPRTHPFVAAAAGTSMPDAELARVAGIPRDLLPLVRASVAPTFDPPPARVAAQGVAAAHARVGQGHPGAPTSAHSGSAGRTPARLSTGRGAPLTYAPGASRRGSFR